MAQDFEYPDTIDAAKAIAEQAAQEADDKASEALDVEQYFLDYSVPIARPTPIIYDPTNPNRIIVSECNMFAIIGEPKSYKSFVASLFVIDFFNQNKSDDCILIDTEQADWNVQNVARRICDGMGWEYAKAYQSGRLKIANLRKYTKAKRKEAVEAIINKYHPRLCIVDGIRDLITSVNDDVESSEVVDKFMEWTATFNCAIGTILHTNKDGETARGHTGFELLAKCETVLLTKNNGNGGATVKSIYHRNAAIDTFDIEIDDKYVPRRKSYTKEERDEVEFATKKETEALHALKVKANRPKQEWVNDIRVAAMCAQQTAEKYFTDFVQFNILVPDDKEYKFFSHHSAPGVTPLTPQPDTQTTIDTSNSMGDDNGEMPF